MPSRRFSRSHQLSCLLAFGLVATSGIVPGGVPQQPLLVRVNVSAFDATGKPLTDLRLEEFTVREAGREQPIRRFLPPQAPLKIVLLIDTSASMIEWLRPVTEQLVDFILSLGPYDEVSVISFSSNVTLETDFTFNPERLQTVLKKLEPAHDPRDVTKLYDAVAIALERLTEQGRARTALLLVTDGEDAGSREAKRDETLDLASRSFVTIYPIYATRRRGGKNDYLERLAQATGGEWYRTDATLPRELGALARHLRYHYVLGYAPTVSESPAGKIPIEVRASRSDARLTATTGYRLFIKK
ncbi:MAG TPA: VWA domain-containing protein [Blastocatellia bacterium]|nr:VWA domain-containing protein [Blastocatellia bacterium]